MKKLLSTSLLMLSGILLQAQEPSKVIEGNDPQILGNSKFESKLNTVSNVEFYTTNYGIFGLNVDSNNSGLKWPRNSHNQYIFGGGIWFGARKWFPNTQGTPEYRKYCYTSYDPSAGGSWLTPGRIEDDEATSTQQYKIYCSTEYNKNDGTPKDLNSTLPWSNWNTSSDKVNEFGIFNNIYVSDTTKRHLAEYPLGPSIISDEDFVSLYKDTDLSLYKIGPAAAKRAGYPLKMQIEQRVLSWSSEEYKDIVVLYYTIENKSTDTLRDCWFAPMFDVDIAISPALANGAVNDRIRYYAEDSTLNMAVAWSQTDQGELGKGLGYIGCSFIESPAISQNGFIRKDRAMYPLSEQLGLVSFRNWNIEQDKKNDQEWYDFMSEIGDSGHIKDGDYGPGDKRLMMSTGPFNMLPGDKARIAVAFTFALPAKGGEADGTTEDIAGMTDGKIALQTENNSLIQKVKLIQKEYYKPYSAGVEDKNNSNIIINEIYPNPSGKNVNIDYNLLNDAEVKISLINQFGTELQVLNSGIRNSGKHTEQLQINTNSLSSGVYYLQIKLGNETKTKAISIVK